MRADPKLEADVAELEAAFERSAVAMKAAARALLMAGNGDPLVAATALFAAALARTGALHAEHTARRLEAEGEAAKRAQLPPTLQ